MTLTHHKTYVNDIPVTITDYPSGGRDGGTAARRLAAQLDRGAGHIREVTNDPLGVAVWMNPPDKKMTRTPTPDGFAVHHVDHFESGVVCVTYEVDK